MDFPPNTPEDAQQAFRDGYEAQMAGRLEEAIEHYSRSLAVHPTAEAHTFLGWALSFQGKHEEAIADYSAALETNPRQVSSLFGRGVAKKRSKADGAADLSLAKSLDPDIAKEFAKYDVSECSR